MESSDDVVFLGEGPRSQPELLAVMKRKAVELDTCESLDDIHHRSTFYPPPGTLLENHPTSSQTQIALEPVTLNEFCLYRHSSLNEDGGGRICSMQVFDFGEGDKSTRDGTGSSRAVLADQLHLYGVVNRDGSENRQGIIIPLLSHYTVQLDCRGQCQIYVHTPYYSYHLVRPCIIYEDTFRSFWTIHQGVATVLQQASRHPDCGLPALINTLEPQEHELNVLSKREFIIHLPQIRQFFWRYSRALIYSVIPNTVEKDSTVSELRKTIQHSAVFVEIIQLAKRSLEDRYDAAGLPTRSGTAKEPQMATRAATIMHNTIKQHRALSPISKHLMTEERYIRKQVEIEISDHGKVKFLSDSIKPDWKFDNGRQQRHWDSVSLNGTTYNIGNGVVIMTAAGPRKGYIRHVTETLKHDKRTGCVHIHWLKELSVGEPKELFLEDARCDEVSLKHLQLKIDFKLLGSGQVSNGRSYFCRLVAESNHRLRDVSPIACDACERKQRLIKDSRISGSRSGLRIGNTEYHERDFLMVDPEETGKPYMIRQLRSIDSTLQKGAVQIRVRVFERASTWRKDGFRDERELLVTDEFEIVPASIIRGKCVVLPTPYSQDKVTDTPAFWSNQRLIEKEQMKVVALQKPTRGCQICLGKFMAEQKSSEAFRQAGMLPLADYYSGAGGGILSAKPYFDVVAAVDINPLACDTLERNHPNIRILCASVADAHHRALQMESGEATGDLYDRRDLERLEYQRKRVSELPRKGTIAVMLAGIPCQGHSRANSHQSSDDHRNEELFWFLAEVERLQPGYIVLENVPGFKDNREDGSFVEASDTMSFAHAALGGLITLGYQCQIALLDSRAYGSPQNRNRIWVVGARRGLKLPDFPQPTHANPRVMATLISLEKNEQAERLTSLYVGEGTPGTGPYPAITVQDAIGDLPAFEFAINSRSRHSSFPSLHRRTGNWGPDCRIGYTTPIPYSKAPQTLYQEAARGLHTKIRDHYTPTRSDGVIELCHRAFTEPYPSRQARCLEAEGGFYTLLTSNTVGGRATNPIHYEQARTKTVAEDKRAMGFPDHYELCGAANDQIAQLGNAWVVPMGQAIVRSIWKVIRDEWVEAGQPEQLKEWWFRTHPVK